MKETLDEAFSLEPDAFQTKWESIGTECKKEVVAGTLESVEEYEQRMQERRQFSIASGQDENEIKLYCYSRYVRSSHSPQMKELVCLVEITVAKSSRKATLVCKSEDHDFANAVAEYLARAFE